MDPTSLRAATEHLWRLGVYVGPGLVVAGTELLSGRSPGSHHTINLMEGVVHFEDEEEREMMRLQEQLLRLSLAWIRVVGESDEFVSGIAAIHRKLFIALRDAGFTEDQALTIVAHQGIGGAQVQRG